MPVHIGSCRHTFDDVPAVRTPAMPAADPSHHDTRYQRIDGNDRRGPIYFLPWNMDFATARWLGLIVGSNWQACYRLPRAMVSPDPELCASCIEAIEQDVLRLAQRNDPPSRLIGF